MHISPIGIIHTPFTSSAGTPIQPSLAEDVEGTVELNSEYREGLRDLEGFDRIWLVYWFDRVCDARLTVVPFSDEHPHGLFATRAPCRPNPIGISSVRLLSIESLTLRVAGVDMLDGTPLLDIKPYIPSFDVYSALRCGWFDHASKVSRADGRFEHGC
jgi:tRNA (adenine37-N6)-methyltransferase